MTKTLKSMSFAVALTLAAALGITAGQTIISPDTAQAGIIKSVKGAAKKVGGAVKTAAKNTAKGAATGVVRAGGVAKSAAKTVGKGAVIVAKQAPQVKTAVKVVQRAGRVIRGAKTVAKKLGVAR